MTFLAALTGIIRASEGRSESAVELLGLADKQPVKATGWMKDWVLLGRVQRELRDELGPGAFEAAWERGHSLELKAVMEQVLQEIESNGQGA
jgi:putative IMPACT (imprinted ancient) family translation regulator